ncbi:hypothetical protein [Phenylobacterium sp.]|uniref:hypothetical protein n=1 Tax=Phenylobacterium sp. TaxID=1871053 RepID=UPI00403663BC
MSGDSFIHSHDIYGVSPEEFLEELLCHLPAKQLEDMKRCHAHMLIPIEDVDGRRYGRAALLVAGLGKSTYDPPATNGMMSVGGFTNNIPGIDADYIGFIDGRTDDASRKAASPVFPNSAVSSWASKQATLIDQPKFFKSELLHVCDRIIALGGDPGSLPYCFHSGTLITYNRACEAISENNVVRLPLFLEYNVHLKFFGYDLIGQNYFEFATKPDVFIPRTSSDRIFDEDETRSLIRSGSKAIDISDLTIRSGAITSFIQLVETQWGKRPSAVIEFAQIFDAQTYSPPAERWTLSLYRDRP